MATGAVGVKEEDTHLKSAVHGKGTRAWTWPCLEAQSAKIVITERQGSGNRRPGTEGHELHRRPSSLQSK